MLAFALDQGISEEQLKLRIHGLNGPSTPCTQRLWRADIRNAEEVIQLGGQEFPLGMLQQRTKRR